MKPDICVFHFPCLDGYTAAWAIHRRWPDIEFVPGVYGQAPPDVTGKDVLLVDFSYKRPVLEEMARTARTITVLDHHRSAEADLAKWAISELEPLDVLADAAQVGGLTIQALFDMNKSGAMLAWEYAFPGEPAPKLVELVQDRDLWRFDLPGTREIAADLFSRPYSWEEWDKAAAALETASGLGRRLVSGQAIERKHQKDVGELLEMTRRLMTIGGHRVWVANLPSTMASDAANALARDMPFGACYYDNAAGMRVFSLRSVDGGADVSMIASAFGGGGHAKAAGFMAPKGWEGE